MLDKIIRGIFSMKMMTVSMVIFAVAIARATFIESDFGTPASKIAIYNATWFEILLLHLCACLIVNIFKYKMFQKGKLATLSFHLSFLLIIVGAALTRYVGFEGQMRIGEGETTNILYSSTPYLTLKSNDLVNQYTHNEKRWLSEGVENPFDFDFQLPNQPKINVEYVSYKEGMIDSLVEDPENGNNAIELIIRGESKFLFEGSEDVIGGLNFSFENENPSQPGVTITEEGGMLYILSNQPYQRVDMSMLSKEDRMTNNISPEAITEIQSDTLVPFYPNQLYMLGAESLVFKDFRKNVSMKKMKSPEKDGGFDFLTLRLSTDSETKEVVVEGSSNHILQEQYIQFAGLNFEIGYGAKPIELPFAIKCREFQLHKYPGSTMASSFASEVTVVDSARGVNHEQRIFMNNVMDYHGYRFFQSSYFPDESGTVLSVNYDWWGTMVTYIAYLIMTIGMIMSLFNKVGRMKELNGLIKKSRENRSKMLKTITLLIGVGLGGFSYAHGDDTTHTHEDEHVHVESHDHNSHAGHDHAHGEHDHSSHSTVVPRKVEINYLSIEDAQKLDDLLVQDYDGRIIPFHTMADKLLRKIHRGDKFGELNAVQTLIAMHLYGPDAWHDVEIAFVSNKIRDELGTGKYVSIKGMEDENGIFKWMDEYEIAHGKSDGQKNEFDKKLIKLGERYTILKEIFQFKHLRIVPIPGDDNGKWIWPFAMELREKDQKANTLAMNLLTNLFAVSQKEAKFSDAQQYLVPLKEYQWEELRVYENENPHLDKLTQRHVDVEIAYNKFKVFDKIQSFYFLFGFLMLILFFFRTLVTPTLKSESIIKKINYVFLAGVILVFIGHGSGLAMRWYISGHAPWSNGYEAVIFIAWSTILAGLFFVKKNPAVIAATTLLGAFMLFVTELNLLDPEITPLQPVLKSYWLMIHVAIITSSYGFLGISMILGLVNMILYLLKNKKNKKRLQMNIIEITSVSEMVMIIGLFMLTIGTFLGGVWANESWGRYWGWDPKETWALVSILVYAIIIHFRFIPALSSKFLFNVLSLWGFSAILFTFFGVNFILVGLHSYAQGDGVAEWPTSVFVAIGAFGTFTLLATVKYLMDAKKKSK
ncbi:cytochrome c biogenesis protein [Brumimicrobium mesophilum]|uniref:cytochrome c biogenesis protein n=1 Tax=Brumimicrobium mesophilum TaxID=392717 RepID=UPI000D143820|nr:cytochrome c biogenesis protein CcsA [Brumimicrobium mesophilum]